MRYKYSAPKTATYTGPSFCTLLGLLFIGLKLTGYITWSWVWVLAPFWIPLALLLIVLIIVGITTILLSK